MSRALKILVATLVLLSVPANAPGAPEPREVRALRKWFKRYRTARSARHRYLEYYPDLWSIKDVQEDRDRRDPAYDQLFGGLRAYHQGRLSSVQLARVIRENRLLRKRGGKDLFYNYARLLEVFGRAERGGDPRAARLFLEIATFRFRKKSLRDEAAVWERIRRYRPALVRREAVLHLGRMTRFRAVRDFLLSALEGAAAQDAVAMTPRRQEIAIDAFGGVPGESLGAGERRRMGAVLRRLHRAASTFWIRMAAARQIGRLAASSSTIEPLAAACEAVLDAVNRRPFSTDTVLARWLVRSWGPCFRRQRQLEAPDVAPGRVDEVVARLLGRVERAGTPRALKLEIVKVLAGFPHLGAARGLVRLLASPRLEAGLRTPIWRALEKLTGIRAGSPGAWLEGYRRRQGPARFGTLGVLVGSGRSFLSWADRHFYRESTGRVAFYGIPVVGRRVVFVVDRSGSMSDPLDRDHPKVSKLDGVKQELGKVIEKLDDRIAFNIIFFSDSAVKYDAKHAWVPATRVEKRRALRFIQRTGNSGATNLMGGLHAAFGRHAIGEPAPLPIPGGSDPRSHALPDQIVVLSDGVPTKGYYHDLQDIADEVHRLNRAGAVRVDVVAFGDESEPDGLGEIAARNGGTLTILPASFARKHRVEIRRQERALRRLLERGDERASGEPAR